ncbi:ferrochelatase [Helicobacter sp. MIT 11-5569]|uniref:ferrochelatase n=1 Tax=Helicobacter sp. MIT 11-5569 TaxID=1548151 RepID=UPI00051FC4E4|nr:ferrochelatase [Helicobacter sp. MIT 11-5569]TLD83893.1 ferrochelatase [Helicobacter sp. MIT 11-5569]
MESEQKIAVVLLNMGGPNSLFEVKTFLKNMFNDPYILPIKSAFLRSVVGSFIVNKRLEEAQSNYQKIGGKSPLVGHTFALCEALSALKPEYYFTYAMRYTPPFAGMVAQDLKGRGIKEVVLFSMYPHFSYTTTVSSMQDILRAFRECAFSPKMVQVERYYKEKAYNLAVLERIKNALNGEDSKDFHLVFSAHSLPKRNIENGDPYQKEILENVAILESLFKECGLEFASIKVAYQSKIGPIKWLEPNLQDVLPKYKGKKLLIYPIAFTMDNSETDFELSCQYKEVAQKVGIVDYRVARCLNSGVDFAECVLGIVEKYKESNKENE